MPASEKTYEVVASSSVMVEQAGGNAFVYPPKTRFTANPSSKCIVRLLRINSIREVSAREIPNFAKKPTGSNG